MSAAGPAMVLLMILGTPAPCTHAAALGEGQDALVLNEQLELDIRSVADARVTYLQRVQVLTARGAEEFRYATVDYGPSVLVEKLEGAVTLPSGKRLRTSRKDVVDAPDQASFELYSDSRRQILTLPGVVPGAVVEVSWQKIVHNLFYMDQIFLLQDEWPARERTFTVREPSGVPLWVSAPEGPAAYAREEKDGVVTHRWIARDVPAFHFEPDGPPALDLLPVVMVRPRVIEWAGHRIDASTWDGVAAFYREIAESRMQPPPEVAAKAAELAAGVAEPRNRARKVYEFLQDEVDYVAISLNLGGYQPHPSGDVLRYRYGDCKDKATLMIAMLRSLDVPALPVLIRTRDTGLVPSGQPSLAFNHAIVAIPAEEGPLFVDPTSTTTPFGDLPWSDQGATALVVGDDGRGTLVTTPVFPAARNERRLTVTGALDGTGGLQARIAVEARGQRANMLASLRSANAGERQERIADLMGSLVPGAQMKGHQVDASGAREGVMRVDLDFTVPRYVHMAGKVDVAEVHIVRFPGLTTMTAVGERRQPVFFRYPFTETVDQTLTLPAGRTVRKLPADSRMEQAGLVTETRYELQRKDGRNVLHITRSITMGRREIPAQEDAAFRTFLSALAAEDARAVTLQAESAEGQAGQP